jgi:radical SAM-linked protein
MSHATPIELPQEDQPLVDHQPAEEIQPAIENNSTATALQRIRMTYARREALRYISHLDMHMVWERTLRRARLPLAYSKGFHPNPRLHLASALPLGFLSRCELCDFWLELPEPPDLQDLIAQVQNAAPPGLEITHAEMISLQTAALQTQVIAAEFCAVPLDAMDGAVLAQTVENLLAEPSIPRERRGKPYDLRLLVESLSVQLAERPELYMRLTAREGATGRPEEVLLALGYDPASFRVERLALILSGS